MSATAGASAGPERKAARSLLPPEVIAIFGPTASGKSAVAELVAVALGTEVVSADAMQVYRGLSILTNHPEHPTRLVAIRDPTEAMSVAEYAGLAHDEIDNLIASNGCVVIAGGTGLYLRAALVDLGVPPAPPPGLREHMEEIYGALGAEGAHARLAASDPAAAAGVHANDRRRVVRALELHASGHSLAAGSDGGRLWTADARRQTLLVGIDVPQPELIARITARTRGMFERGVAAEVAALPPASATAQHVIGLTEVLTLATEDAISAIDLRTRRYAAYQRKWLRRLPVDLLLDGRCPPPENAARILACVRAVAG